MLCRAARRGLADDIREREREREIKKKSQEKASDEKRMAAVSQCRKAHVQVDGRV